MAERLRWWVIPGALVVLVRVVTLGEATPVVFKDQPSAPAVSPAVAEAAPLAESASGPVLVRDASGRRSRPVTLQTSNALILALPRECAGQRVELTVWRRGAAGREAEPWLSAKPRVRDDALVPIGGQPAGRYDVEVVWTNGTDEQRRHAENVAVPGPVDLRLPQ